MVHVKNDFQVTKMQDRYFCEYLGDEWDVRNVCGSGETPEAALVNMRELIFRIRQNLYSMSPSITEILPMNWEEPESTLIKKYGNG